MKSWCSANKQAQRHKKSINPHKAAWARHTLFSDLINRHNCGFGCHINFSQTAAARWCSRCDSCHIRVVQHSARGEGTCSCLEQRPGGSGGILILSGDMFLTFSENIAVNTNTNITATFSASAASRLSACPHMQTYQLKTAPFDQGTDKKEPEKQKGGHGNAVLAQVMKWDITNTAGGFPVHPGC